VFDIQSFLPNSASIISPSKALSCFLNGDWDFSPYDPTLVGHKEKARQNE